jgi:hypothetical protein
MTYALNSDQYLPMHVGRVIIFAGQFTRLNFAPERKIKNT